MHLLVDVSFPGDEVSNESVVEYLKQFDAATDFHWTIPQDEPLGKQHVEAALRALGIEPRFLKYNSNESCKAGLVVKSIALRIRLKKASAYAYAVAVLALDRSIDMNALSLLLEVEPEEVTLADQETLIRVFGFSRGSLGPVGLREQQSTRIILDSHAQSASYLLCGAGTADEVYPIAPDTLVNSVQASVASISKASHQSCG